MKISDDRLNYHIANVEECAEVQGNDAPYSITVGEMSQLLDTLVGLRSLLDLPTTVHKAPDVTPDDMIRYLEANGYVKHGDNIKCNGYENAFSYYIHKDDTEAEGVWVPLRNELNDWKARCIDAMRAMASSMDKTQLRVWYELTMITKKDGPN